MGHPEPRIVVSECLGFRPTRYDDNIFHDKIIETLRKVNDRVRLVTTKTGEDLLDRMEDFVKSFVNSLTDADGFLLKSRNPWCGVGDAKVYGKCWAVIGRSDGVFTRIIRSTFPLLPIESEKRLLKYEIKRNFFTKIFAIADLRGALSRRGKEELLELHRRDKYILMLYSPHLLKKLGKLVADRALVELDELKRAYRMMFLEAL